ncbi:MAG TPA: 1-deoxy-D-xylulose-5-phosphate reductoisomerase [Planctomycetes bacterium]|nr:1-deoxy-D-xylulose-5-phosphate reductoisomerase [Planctomycetota bacterium]
MINIGLFGSTGSIGESTLDILRKHADRFRADVLAAGSRLEDLARQALEFNPSTLVIADPQRLSQLRDLLGAEASRFRLLAGEEGLVEAAALPTVDIVLQGISGAQGLPVSLAAASAGKRLGLANKESMVMAGPLLQETARRSDSEIIPVDSEHSALFQCLAAGRPEDVDRLILTASGGPFRTRPQESFADVTLEEALKHPTWDMGPKITIDSATMFNKALEIVEARWLFDVGSKHIEVCVHPQSVVHSMVLWRDGSVIAQMGAPDMKVPIQYAITYPARLDGTVQTWSPELFDGLRFFAPDLEKFPSLRLGFLAAEKGGTYGAVLNAANEQAVAMFVDGQIGFQDIFDSVATVMERHDSIASPNLAEILAADRWAREELASCF